MNVDPLLKAGEVSALLQISTVSMYRRVKDGTLPPPVKLGNLSRWSKADVLAALDLAKSPGVKQ